MTEQIFIQVLCCYPSQKQHIQTFADPPNVTLFLIISWWDGSDAIRGGTPREPHDLTFPGIMSASSQLFSNCKGVSSNCEISTTDVPYCNLKLSLCGDRIRMVRLNRLYHSLVGKVKVFNLSLEINQSSWLWSNTKVSPHPL